MNNEMTLNYYVNLGFVRFISYNVGYKIRHEGVILCWNPLWDFETAFRQGKFIKY